MEDHCVTINDLDLVQFFEADHVSRTYGSEWYDSDSVYEWTDVDGLKATLAIHPIHKDVRITIGRSGCTFFDWSIVGAIDIRFDESRDHICIQEDDRYSLILSLRPTIALKRFVDLNP